MRIKEDELGDRIVGECSNFRDLCSNSQRFTRFSHRFANVESHVLDNLIGQFSSQHCTLVAKGPVWSNFLLRINYRLYKLLSRCPIFLFYLLFQSFESFTLRKVPIAEFETENHTITSNRKTSLGCF